MSGLLGHIDHLYENPNLTLEDIVKIYRNIANNTGDILAYEKVDGYNVFLSYSAANKSARLLRNNSQIKTGGISLSDLIEEYTTKRISSGKPAVPPNIVKMYKELITYFEKTIQQVLGDEEQIKLIFGNSSNNSPEFFFNCELIDPFAPNVIKYSKKAIIFHKLGNIKINQTNGTVEDVDTDEIRQKFSELSEIFINTFDSRILLSDDKPAEFRQVNIDKLEQELSQLRLEFKKFKLDMKNTIGEYFISSIEKYISEQNQKFDNKQTEFIVKSILSTGFGRKYLKKPNINDYLNTSSYGSQEVKNYSNEEPAKKIFNIIKSPIEDKMFNCASVLLDRYESIYLSNNKQSAEDIISLVNQSINNINKSGSSKDKEILQKNLNKLRSSSVSFENIINNPVEGIVFSFKNHTYKITSSFGPVNQIVNMNNFQFKTINENKTTSVNGVKVLFAGAFKPPHKGHLEVIKNFFKLPSLTSKNFTVEKVIVIMGDKARFSSDSREFPLKQSYELFKLYLKASGLSDLVEVRITQRQNPVKDVYDYITNENNDLDKAQSGDIILLGVSAKDRSYYSNLSKYVKDKPWQILFGTEYEIPSVFKNDVSREHDILGEYSASEFRDAIAKNDVSDVKSFLPEEILASKEYLSEAFRILGIAEVVEPIKENRLVKIINSKIAEPSKVQPKLNLNELINRVNSIYINK